MNAIHKDLIYLLSCAVNGITPDKDRVQAIDLQLLYRYSGFHMVLAAVCIALERAGVHEEHFYEAYKKAVRKNIYLDIERASITSDFDEQGIWYVPLKGSVLKEFYPENGMREMSDNDMLYDVKKQQKVRKIMLSHGYTAESVGVSHHDVYMKPPVLNFELHTLLFDKHHAEPLCKYYADAKRLLLKDEDNNYGYHFSDEDFYIYITAHEWKHHSGSGTGIRSLLDCYVYCKEKGDTLDWNYITEQCKQLEIAGFERARRKLAMKVLSSPELPELNSKEQDLLEQYLNSGTYGTYSRYVERAIKKHYAKTKNKSKISYVFARMFPDMEFMKQYYPFFYKHKVILPVGYIWRLIKCLAVNRRTLWVEIKTIVKFDNRKA